MKAQLRLFGVTAALAMSAAPGYGDVQRTVYDIPSPRGATVRTLVLQPDNPVATVILFAGGNGWLDMQSDGTINMLGQNFLVRTSGAFADYGLTVAVVDAPSDRLNATGLNSFRQTPGHLQDMQAVVAFMKGLNPIPVWLVGTSNGTLSVGFLSGPRGFPGGEQFGVVLTSSIVSSDDSTRDVFEMDFTGMRRNVLLIHNLFDQCSAAPYFTSAAVNVAQLLTHFPNAPAKFLGTFAGGVAQSEDPCDALTFHGYYKIEADVVGTIFGWIVAHPPGL